MKPPFKRVLSASLVASSSAFFLTSCQVTAAQNEPLSPVTKVEPIAALVTKGRGTLPRSLWVWDATVITNPKQEADLFDFCAQKGITVIYASVGDIFSPRQRESTDPKHVTAPMLGKFLAAAHAKGLEVEALDGDPSFTLEAKHPEALLRLQKALDYNKQAAPNEKLDGFQWDTEPYILPEFRASPEFRQDIGFGVPLETEPYILPEFRASPESQREILKQYLDSAAQMVSAVKVGPPMRLGYAIPSFFDGQERALEWNGTTKPPAYHLMDLLNTLPSSYIAIMAYRDKALGTNGTVEISQGEADYATKTTPKVKVWIGQETLDVKGDPPSITFWQEGENALEQALGQIEVAFKKQPAVAGLAIHHWASYRILKPGEPVGAAKPTAPITEPLTILTPKADEAVPTRTEATGTAKPGGEGVKIAVSVRPQGDIWYTQGEVPLGNDGTWSVVCRFGNENTPAGRNFELRAQLLAADGKVVKEQIIPVKTR